MDKRNATSITHIRLLGLQTGQSVKMWVFFLFLLIYCMTICGNFLIITVVSYSKTLQSPMYLFLSQLSVADILLITDIVPNMLHTIITEEATMPFSGCIFQLYIFGVLEISECLLLTVMSYDRYLAICRPLHYTLVMKPCFCWILVFVSWSLSVTIVLNNTLTILQLHFCGPNIINHFFCDLDPVLKLSCSNIAIIQLEVTLVSGVFVVIPFLIIIVSYMYIVITIFEMPSVTGRRKVFSTCSSHLTVVSIFYGTLLCVYLVPNKGQSRNITKFLSLLYTVATPLLNPIIYSLRNKDLKSAVGPLITKTLNIHL
ncbi:olfactory receptor 11L1-like [Gastrophryne carolinensis]